MLFKLYVILMWFYGLGALLLMILLSWDYLIKPISQKIRHTFKSKIKKSVFIDICTIRKEGD